MSGDLCEVINALFEHLPLPEPCTEAERGLQALAEDTARLWYKELPSYGCTHCPMPMTIRSPGMAR